MTEFEPVVVVHGGAGTMNPDLHEAALAGVQRAVTAALACLSDDDFALVFDASGTQLRIQKVQAFTPPPHTQLGWAVASIATVVDALAGKGVATERYGFLDQDARGVWTAPSGTRIAWFKDPDGNLLSVSEPPL